MKKLIAGLLLWCASALAQMTVTVPSQTIVTPLTINGTTIKLTITIPSQRVNVPASAGASALPYGMSYSPTAGLTVNGPITSTGPVTAPSVSLTGGPVLPTCPSQLFLWQMVNGALQPACYVPPAVTSSLLHSTPNYTTSYLTTGP